MVYLAYGSPALAACGGVPTGTPGLQCDRFGAPGDSNPIYALLQFTINFFLTYILIPVAVLAIVISGIQLAASAGSPDAIKRAKGHLTNAITGLILLSLFKVILTFIGIGK